MRVNTCHNTGGIECRTLYCTVMVSAINEVEAVNAATGIICATLKESKCRIMLIGGCANGVLVHKNAALKEAAMLMGFLTPISIESKHLIVGLGKVKHKAHKLSDINLTVCAIDKLNVTADNIAFLEDNIVKLQLQGLKLLVLKDKLKGLSLAVCGGKALGGICSVNDAMAIVYEVANEGSVGHKKLDGAMTVVTSANAGIFEKISLKEEVRSLGLNRTAKVDGVLQSRCSKVCVNHTTTVIKLLGIPFCNAEGVGCVRRFKSEQLFIYTYHFILLIYR
jgi:hypothetical protein